MLFLIAGAIEGFSSFLQLEGGCPAAFYRNGQLMWPGMDKVQEWAAPLPGNDKES